MGYWLDYSDPYITYSNDYIESVWWALETLHSRGLLYVGHKILPYCARCGTALSSHEVAQGYRDVKDPSVYLMLELDRSGLGTRDSRRREGPESRVPSPAILVWTTTPWTLVSNVALAVNPEFTYVELKRKRKSEPALHHGRGARGRGARRGLGRSLGDRVALPGHGARGAQLQAAARLAAVSRGEARDHRRRGVRVGRGWQRRGAHGAGVRRRRFRGGEAARPLVAAAGGRSRAVPRGSAGGRREVREGGRRRDHRGAEAARRALESGHDRALVSALLALRHAALYYARKSYFVRTTGFRDRDARAQRARRLASARGRPRPVRRVAREQHRLGDLARPLLGHAAADLGVRARRRPRRSDRQLRRSSPSAGERRCPPTSIRTSRTSTSTRGRARTRSAAARCAARRR